MKERRIYMNVPYEQKNWAKSKGARWDPERRQWYVPPGGDLASFIYWIEFDREGRAIPKRNVKP